MSSFLSLRNLFKETRTRILLLYAVLLCLLTGMTVPVFRYFLFRDISMRVRESMDSERQEFLDAYMAWEAPSEQVVDDLEAFIDDFLVKKLPEDDNFHIVIIDDELYRSNPRVLKGPFQPDSELFQTWQQVRAFTRGESSTDDPTVGDVLYKADPLFVDGQPRGVYVIVHMTAGEREEALAGVSLFMKVLFAVVALSLLLSWVGAGRLMAPIRGLAETARSISESDLTRRIPPVSGNGELADLAETFNAMMNRIQQAFDSQRAFVNDAGHELRTPITIIRGHLELLDDDPQARQETVELLLDELDRMGRLVNDLILLAKSEQTDFLQLETIEVGALMEDLFAKAKTLAHRNWVLTVEARGSLVGDHQRLTGALLNLLRNAAQHTKTSDTIELGCSMGNHFLKSRRQVHLWVRDTGEGIGLADQIRIFDRFSRGSSTQRRSDGSGLGLAIVSAIAEAHGGRVDLVSEVGKGSTFQITLPMEPPNSVKTATPRPVAAEWHPARLESETV